MAALAPEWASPLNDSTDDLLRFTNTGSTCDVSGYPAVVAVGAGQLDVRAKPGVLGQLPSDGGSIVVVPNGSSAQVLVGAVHSCLAPHRYTMLTVAMPGGGSISVTLPKYSVSPNPNFNGRDLTLLLAPSCPPYLSSFTH